MSCDGMTLHMPDGDEFCIPIYYEPVKWPPPGPGPERFYHDLRILAVINEGIQQVSDRGVRDKLATAVQGSARALSLPKGVELGDGLFKGQRAMELAE